MYTYIYVCQCACVCARVRFCMHLLCACLHVILDVSLKLVTFVVFPECYKQFYFIPYPLGHSPAPSSEDIDGPQVEFFWVVALWVSTSCDTVPLSEM